MISFSITLLASYLIYLIGGSHNTNVSYWCRVGGWQQHCCNKMGNQWRQSSASVHVEYQFKPPSGKILQLYWINIRLKNYSKYYIGHQKPSRHVMYAIISDSGHVYCVRSPLWGRWCRSKGSENQVRLIILLYRYEVPINLIYTYIYSVNRPF